MAELQVTKTLDAKRLEIEGHIGSLEQDLEQARRDLSAILAAIKVFSAEGPKVTAYMNLSRLFPRHELPRLAKAALAASPDGISTTGIAAHVIAAKGLDEDDRHLRKAITYKAIQVVRRWERQGVVVRVGKTGGTLIWRQSSSLTIDKTQSTACFQSSE
ncbi:hypothetical protein BH10PSE7_BH10PSE7_37900 [soil metagenome]